MLIGGESRDGKEKVVNSVEGCFERTSFSKDSNKLVSVSSKEISRICVNDVETIWVRSVNWIQPSLW